MNHQPNLTRAFQAILGFRFICPLLLVCFALLPWSAQAQLQSLEDVESIDKGFFKTHFKGLFKDFTDFGEPLTINGSVGLDMRSYSTYNGPLRQDPFMYTLNSAVNVRIYKIDIPVSFLVTARNTESSLPNLGELGDAFRDQVPSFQNSFARIGLSPYYKWIKLHLGHRTMSFSPYTLNNLNFFGAGAELTPGKYRLAVMYGRLADAEPVDLSLVSPNIPVYERRGWGTKLGVGEEDSSIDFIVFKAFDDANSIFIPDEAPRKLSPANNLTLGVNINKLMLDRIRFRIDYAHSLVNENSLGSTLDGKFLTDLFIDQKQNAVTGNAFDASLDFEGKAMTAGIQLKRVDPTFETFGAYFFNRDIADLLGNLSFNLLKNKLNIRLGAGVQSNNLNLLRPATTSRSIYNASATYSAGPFTITSNYNNNASEVGYVLNQQLDSLNAVIVAEDLGLTATYAFPAKGGVSQSLTLSANLQSVNDDLENPVVSNNSSLIVVDLGWNLAFGESGWRLGARVNYNENELAQVDIKRYGVGGSIANTFFDDQLNIQYNSNYFINESTQVANTTNWINQIGLSYQANNAIAFNTNWALLQTSNDLTNINFGELTGNLGIQYSFNTSPFSRKENNDKNQ